MQKIFKFNHAQEVEQTIQLWTTTPQGAWVIGYFVNWSENTITVTYDEKKLSDYEVTQYKEKLLSRKA